MSELHGTKETKELLVGVNELSLFLVSRLKDGVDVSDAAAVIEKLASDPAFVDVLKSAVEGVKAVGAEVGDLSVAEGMELAVLQLSYVPKWVEAVKSEPEAPAAA